MNKITDVGIIIAATLVAAGLMFSTAKDLTAWMFIIFAAYLYIKTWVADKNIKLTLDDEDELHDGQDQ